MKPPVNPAIQAFMDNAIAKFSSEFTDTFFKFIENDRELLKQYLNLLGNNPLSLQDVNRQIPIVLMDRYELTNPNVGDVPATSKLIQTYTPLQ